MKRGRQYVALFGGVPWIFRDVRLSDQANRDLANDVAAANEAKGLPNYETWRRRMPGDKPANEADVDARAAAQTSAEPIGKAVPT